MGEDRREQLLTAVKEADTVLVQEALASGLSPLFTLHRGDTLLHIAAAHGNPKIIQLLLMNGADINAENCGGNRPLHTACDLGRFTIVKALIKANVDVNVRNKQGITPLHVACSRGLEHTVKVLLKHGADREAADKHGQTPLHISSKTAEDKCSISFQLLRLGVDVNKADEQGNTVLHVATKYKNASLITVLLNLGADINAANACNLLPLHNAYRVLPFPYDSLRTHRMFLIFQQHISKLFSLNLPIHPDNLSLINNFLATHFVSKHIFLQQHTTQCQNELCRLKDTYIRPGINYYHLLHANYQQLNNWFKNPNFLKNVTLNNLRKLFPIYGENILFKFESGYERNKLMEAGMKSFFELINFLPELCVENILNCLSNRELRILTKNIHAPKVVIYSI